jgi:alkylated DNA repair dioxygenase AlkB
MSNKNKLINVDLSKIGPSKIATNIIKFIVTLSYDDFILAGNSVANMIENVGIRGDLDFWVLDKSKYLSTLEEFKSKNPLSFNIFPSMIEMTFDNLPTVSIILSDMSAEATIKSFDFDYCRCYYTRQQGCIAFETTLVSIFTKSINHEIVWGDIRSNRIIKAIMYGYNFSYKFWHHFEDFLKNKEKLICKICKVTSKKIDGYCEHTENLTVKIQSDDLNLSRFAQGTFEIKITDPTNIDNSIAELLKIFRNTNGIGMFQMSKLFSFNPTDYELVKIYATKIILLNPVRDGNYMNIVIDPKLQRTNNAARILKIGKSSESEYESENESENESDIEYEEESVKNESDIEYEEESTKNESDDEPFYDDIHKEVLKKPNILTYNPEFDVSKTISLTKLSYLKISHLPSALKQYGIDNFNEMFLLHPPNKHKIIMYETEVEVHRWQQSYLNTPKCTPEIIESRSYMYSGFDTSNNNNLLPKQFQIFYDYMKNLDERYNQVVINWYDEDDYIAYHADCESCMISNAEIAIISIYGNDSNNSRMFSLIPKDETQKKCEYDKFNIIAKHGSIITMCGDTQKEFKHGIEKDTTNSIPQRISISFRQMI